MSSLEDMVETVVAPAFPNFRTVREVFDSQSASQRLHEVLVMMQFLPTLGE